MFSVVLIEPNIKFDIKNFNNLQKEFDERIIELINYFKTNKYKEEISNKYLLEFLHNILPGNEI